MYNNQIRAFMADVKSIMGRGHESKKSALGGLSSIRVISKRACINVAMVMAKEGVYVCCYQSMVADACTCTCIPVHVHVYLYMYMYTCTCTCIPVHVHVYLYMYMYTCTCTCIPVHVHGRIINNRCAFAKCECKIYWQIGNS